MAEAWNAGDLPHELAPTVSFGSIAALASALRRAEKAHAEYEKRLGHRDENWPDWYAAYMAGLAA